MRAMLWMVLLVGCGNPTGPQASDYDDSCSTVADCEAVVQHPGCCGCRSYVALNTADAGEFEADQDRFWDRHQCRSVCLIGCFELPPESSLTLSCDAGTCGVEVPDTGSPAATPTE